MVLIFTERYEFPRKSYGLGFESIRAEKERRKVGSEGSGEHDIESLGSSTVEEHIVDEADFVFIISHIFLHVFRF